MVSRQIIIGAILNYLNMALGFGFTLFVFPFIIRSLGPEEFGLFSLIGVFAEYFALLQFGMSGTITRYVAKFNAENDQVGRENFLAIVFVLHIVSAALILIVGVVLMAQLDTIFAASLTNVEAIIKSKEMLAILVVSAAFCSVTSVLVGTLSGFEEFIFPRAVSTVSWCVRILATFAILTLNPTAVAITAITATLAVLSGFVNSIYAFSKYSIKIKLHVWDKRLLMEIVSFSFFIFLMQVMGLLYWKVGETIIGMKLSITLVGIYSIGIQLNAFALQFSNSINNLLLPHATNMVTRGASTEQTTLFVANVGRVILVLYGGIYLGFVFFGKLFIKVWAGEAYVQAYYITIIALSAAAIPRIQAGMNNVLKAKNMHKFPAVVFLISSVLTIPFAWLLSERFGILGIVSSTAVGLVVGNVIVSNIYYVKVVGFDLHLFCKKTFSGSWPVIMIASLTCYASTFIKGDDLSTLITQCTIHVIVYSISVFSFGLNKSERGALLSSVGGIGKLIRYRVGA